MVLILYFLSSSTTEPMIELIPIFLATGVEYGDYPTFYECAKIFTYPSGTQRPYNLHTLYTLF